MTIAEKNAVTILQAFSTIMEVFGWRHERPDVRAAIDTLARPQGVLPANTLSVVRFMGTAHLRREVRLAFGLAVDIDIELGRSFGARGNRLQARVSWSSGGGDVVNALAEASLHMEWAQKVAQAEVVLNQATSSLSDDEVKEACRELEARAERLWEQIRPIINPTPESDDGDQS